MGRRLVAICAVASVALVVALATAPISGQTRSASGYVPPRTADGQPDLQGIWRVWSLAQYDLEPHAASYGVPAGTGVIDPPDGLIPYKPWALARKKENFAKSRIRFPYDPLQSPDPLARCYIPGVTDTKEIWSRTGNTLTIQKSQSSEGLSETETAVFDRSS